MPVALQLNWRCGSVEGGDAALAELRTAFLEFAENLNDFEQYVWPRVTRALEKAVAEHFGVEGADGAAHGSWAPLSKKYAKWKEAHYPGRPIEVLRGNLKKALTQSSSAHAFRESNRQAMVFGTADLPYASAQQEGTEHMPARPPLDFEKDVLGRDLTMALRLGMVDAMRASRSAQLVGMKVLDRELDSAIARDE